MNARDVIGNFINFFLSYFNHQLMILRIITYIACYVLFFQTTNPMFQAGRTWDSPWSY